MAHALRLKRVSSAHEDVVTTVFSIKTKGCGHFREITDDVISLLLRRSACALRSPLNINPVLVRASEEVGLEAALLFMTVHAVSHDHRVEMAKVWETVGVIDGCGYVERLRHACESEMRKN